MTIKLLSLIILITNFHLLKADNIALNKLVLNCQRDELSNRLVDGDTSFDNVEVISCDRSTVSVFVSLQGNYIVHYVVVYEGRGFVAGQMDFFRVELIDLNNSMSSFEFADESYEGRQGMRVNCDTNFRLIKEVQILPNSGNELHLTEIEIHSIGLLALGSDHRPFIYRGCFQRFDDRQRRMYNEDNIVEQCRTFCLRLGAQFIAIKNTECYCSNKFDYKEELDEAYCKSCHDGIRKCGGDNSFSVYVARLSLPTYVGCYPMTNINAKKRLQTDNMTVQECLYMCENYKFSLLTWGHNCICQNQFKGIKASQSECQTKCNGDDSQFCGSISHMSVYTSCANCTKLFRCNEAYDKHGDCGSRCKLGFKSESCLVRNITVTIRTTPEILTITEELTETFTHIDNCSPGYFFNNVTYLCEDVNECDSQPCDLITSTCTNSNGSYTCDCKPGFNIIQDNCTAIVETEDSIYNNPNMWVYVGSIIVTLFAIL